VRGRSLARLAASGLALIAGGVAFTGCAEVESNLVESQPYELKTIKGSDIKVVRLEDKTAQRIDLQTASVRDAGERKVVPHEALIYNPEGAVFVYERARPKSYVRRPVEVVRVEGDRAILSKGPRLGATVVTVGAAELLATEYEILNQHP
jgi:hypothetical protein